MSPEKVGEHDLEPRRSHGIELRGAESASVPVK
jgi:hypothetical protein